MPNSITVSHLTKQFSVYHKGAGLKGAIASLWSRPSETVTAVNDVSFTVEEGEVVGFIGQNGAGKTTTLKMLSGLLHPTSGTASVLGFQPWQRQREFQKQFSLVMGQKTQLWWDLPALDTFELNRAIYQIPDKTYRNTLDHLAQLLDVADKLQIQVRKLSLGERMKCELIAALLHGPKILFLDEPTIGLDVVMQKVLRDFIRDYNREFNATIILTSHYMNDVKELCERAIVIDHGSKVYDGALQKLIDTYGKHKLLKLVFSSAVKRSQLERFGEIREWGEDGSTGTATLEVSRQRAAAHAAQLLQTFPVQDITIEEPPIEAIIRDVFSKQSAVKKK